MLLFLFQAKDFLQRRYQSLALLLLRCCSSSSPLAASAATAVVLCCAVSVPLRGRGEEEEEGGREGCCSAAFTLKNEPGVHRAGGERPGKGGWRRRRREAKGNEEGRRRGPVTPMVQPAHGWLQCPFPPGALLLSLQQQQQQAVVGLTFYLGCRVASAIPLPPSLQSQHADASAACAVWRCIEVPTWQGGRVPPTIGQTIGRYQGHSFPWPQPIGPFSRDSIAPFSKGGHCSSPSRNATVEFGGELNFLDGDTHAYR